MTHHQQIINIWKQKIAYIYNIFYHPHLSQLNLWILVTVIKWKYDTQLDYTDCNDDAVCFVWDVN